MALTPGQLSGAKLGTGRSYIGSEATRQAIIRQFGVGALTRDPKTGKTYFKGTFGTPTAPTSPAAPAAPVAPTADSITQSFIDSIKGLLPKQAAPVTPFDQAGFYNENDAKAAVNQEYDPWAARQKAYQDTLNAEQDRQTRERFENDSRNTMEQVNAAGGFRSSAYQRDAAQAKDTFGRDSVLRQEAIKRAAEEQANTLKVQKDQSVLARRNEAYQRYLQGIGAVAA